MLLTILITASDAVGQTNVKLDVNNFNLWRPRPRETSERDARAKPQQLRVIHEVPSSYYAQEINKDMDGGFIF